MQVSVFDLGSVDYSQAWRLQSEIHAKVVSGELDSTLLLLEHPHTYTLGKTADKAHLIAAEEFLQQHNIKVFDIDRGGDITYHGPGQLVGYPILNLTEWHKDTHKYLRYLEEMMIRLCLHYGLEAERKDGLTGVWIGQRKIAAIGVKVSRWVTMHGFAFNVNTDLQLFNGIIPCGIRDKEVTSLQRELGRQVSMDEVKTLAAELFCTVFGAGYTDIRYKTPEAFYEKERAYGKEENYNK